MGYDQFWGLYNFPAIKEDVQINDPGLPDALANPPHERFYLKQELQDPACRPGGRDTNDLVKIIGLFKMAPGLGLVYRGRHLYARDPAFNKVAGFFQLPDRLI